MGGVEKPQRAYVAARTFERLFGAYIPGAKRAYFSPTNNLTSDRTAGFEIGKTWGASEPLIRIGDLRSRRSKGGQQFTDH
jgi:hypothetical protein